MSEILAEKLTVSRGVDIEVPGYFVIRHKGGADSAGVYAEVWVVHGPYDTEVDAEAIRRTIKGPGFKVAFFPGVDADDAGVVVH